MSLSTQELARFIDHTLLAPDASEPRIRNLVAEAAEYGLASVCVTPRWVSLCAELLRGTEVKTCTVVGFPLGASTTAQKVFEAQSSCAAGAQEIDMVIDIADANAGHRSAVERQIAAVAETVHQHRGILKVIIETALLTQEAKELACQAAVAAGADYVKTSTGFASAGATEDDVALMSQLVSPGLGVKASGGVRTRADADAMIAAGATRLGASASLDILGVSAPSDDGAY